MNKYKAVIFDLDDTLYPEFDYVKSGFNSVATLLSPRIDQNVAGINESLLKLFHDDRADVFNRYLSLQGIEDKRVLAECIMTYRGHFPNISLSSDVRELLYWLKNNQLGLGILTDGRPDGQRNKIKALELDKIVDAVIVTDELGGVHYRKPNELAYRRICSQLEIQANEAIYVGDNPAKDFISANQLGMVTVMLKNDHSLYKQEGFLPEQQAQMIIKDLRELKSIVFRSNHEQENLSFSPSCERI
ncbi:HAD family hydrolase [Heliobacterium chlorum]|uniref:HAD family hydrolase n=1 Tax=Heliobacterium chlorum TaxID=2698 RepID=A0ABR7T6W5_HELCL|nr:HAD family hydrolase [Heliobacterium chlorum]MBC9785842.1 HAD family hydrolase [Heliobacterium chlorum]